MTTNHQMTRDLQFDWEKAMDAPIRAVLCREQRVMNDNSLAWDAIAFVIKDRAIVLTVNEDTDEVVVSFQNASATEDWNDVPSLSYAIGRTFGWCWNGSNYRGYDDTFIVAFGDVVPDALRPHWMFLGEGSSLICFELRLHRC